MELRLSALNVSTHYRTFAGYVCARPQPSCDPLRAILTTRIMRYADVIGHEALGPNCVNRSARPVAHAQLFQGREGAGMALRAPTPNT